MDYSAENLYEMVNTKTITVGERYLIDITYIKNPHHFFVRPAEYFEYLPAIGKPGEALERSDLEAGINVSYMSKLGECIRGQIMSINLHSKTYTVYASDYGFIEENVELKNIHKLLCDLPIPALALKCKLADSRPKGDYWSQEAVDAMKEFVAGDYLKMHVYGQTSDLLTVQLHNWKGPDVATLMALSGYSTLFAPSTVSRFPENLQKQTSNQHAGPGASE